MPYIVHGLFNAVENAKSIEFEIVDNKAQSLFAVANKIEMKSDKLFDLGIGSIYIKSIREGSTINSSASDREAEQIGEVILNWLKKEKVT